MQVMKESRRSQRQEKVYKDYLSKVLLNSFLSSDKIKRVHEHINAQYFRRLCNTHIFLTKYCSEIKLSIH